MISNADSHNQRMAAEEAQRVPLRLNKPSRWDVAPDGRIRLPRPKESSGRERGGLALLQRRSASPEPGPQPARKVRQWDLGKNMYL